MLKILKNLNHKTIWFDSMVGMTWGFIASLIVGTIFGLLGTHQSNAFSNFVLDIKRVMSYITPFAIGIGIGIKAKLNPLQIFALGLGCFLVGQSLLIPNYDLNRGIIWNNARVGINTILGRPGDVFAAWLSGVFFVYFFAIVKFQTFIDILIVPIMGVVIGLINSLWLTYFTSTILVILEFIIEHTANKVHWAGILLAPIIGVIMGLALSLPTSSAAIALALRLHGDAATAAIIGTSAEMLTFGVMTYFATRSWGKTLAVSFGTSMLQMHNFLAKPKLLILPMVITAIVPLIAVAAIPLEFAKIPSATSGMGTCALYGQIFTLDDNGWSNYKAWLLVLIFELSLPILLSVAFSMYIFKKGWIKSKDLEIQYG